MNRLYQLGRIVKITMALIYVVFNVFFIIFFFSLGALFYINLTFLYTLFFDQTWWVHKYNKMIKVFRQQKRIFI